MTQGQGPYADPNIPDKKCRNCGQPADLLGHNARLFPDDEAVTHPARYYPLCLACAQIGREEK